jgi:hypothetical protein
MFNHYLEQILKISIVLLIKTKKKRLNVVLMFLKYKF